MQISASYIHIFWAKSSLCWTDYDLKRIGPDIKEVHPTVAKTNQNNFYIDDSIRSVETFEEAIDVFNPLQLHPQHGFELKQSRSNDDAVIEAIKEDPEWKSSEKQVEVEHSTEILSLLGLQ